MSERLRTLHRQQALLREHLAWLDGEIAREANQPKPDTAPVALPTTPPLSAATTADPAPDQDPAPDVDALIERYASSERQNPADLRRGCLLVFSAGLTLMIVSVVMLWLVFYR
jgi:hypothetical protein